MKEVEDNDQKDEDNTLFAAEVNDWAMIYGSGFFIYTTNL